VCVSRGENGNKLNEIVVCEVDLVKIVVLILKTPQVRQNKAKTIQIL